MTVRVSSETALSNPARACEVAPLELTKNSVNPPLRFLSNSLEQALFKAIPDQFDLKGARYVCSKFLPPLSFLRVIRTASRSECMVA